MLKSFTLKKFFIFLLFFIPTLAFAGSIGVKIKLESIKVIKPAEKGGDEIYFSVTSYAKKKEPIFKRVPMFPVHWLAKHLKKVKDVILWEGTLAEGDAHQIVLSLVEQDIPPWNIDDHLGSVKVKIANERGTFRRKWTMPDYKDQTKVKQTDRDSFNPSFVFYGEGGKYRATFKLDIKE